MLTEQTEINKIFYFIRYYQRDEWVVCPLFRVEVKIPKYPVACWSEAEIPPCGAAGIGILAFRPRSDNVALYKIAPRFYCRRRR